MILTHSTDHFRVNYNTRLNLPKHIYQLGNSAVV